MLLFELLRYSRDHDICYQYQRIREETLISIEIKHEMFLSEEHYSEFEQVMEWCNHHSKGLVTAPLYIGTLLTNDENLEDMRNGGLRRDDTFFLSFTNLSDAGMVKLMIGDFFVSQGVWIYDPSDNIFLSTYNAIQDVSEILLYRPNAVLDNQ